MQQTVKTYTVDEALKKLENYCAYQDRCHKEVQEKLKEMRMIPEAIDHIIYQLIQDKFLDEERFARSFARGKFRSKKWGKTRIIRELKLREITKYNIDLALTEIEETDYLKTFEKLVKKRLKQLKTEKNLYKKKNKLMTYLQYRGWESNLIYEKINELK
ncbi:regulatory protein RecX [Leeuwenhoekiella sp. A16]|uniref:regulatory protein RecX n=1 Tax=unclassified Leeuwenhoekiella TaxID=2615029 RepID=UPI003A803732